MWPEAATVPTIATATVTRSVAAAGMIEATAVVVAGAMLTEAAVVAGAILTATATSLCHLITSAPYDQQHRED
ncbi:MAG: hypothetical protein EYX74_07080 [Desulfobulbaceae bacterium]|nr:MAG: hypothetical protein EYX74_07080 [Desulfobulbaceae bacterium]